LLRGRPSGLGDNPATVAVGSEHVAVLIGQVALGVVAVHAAKGL
jgi:hypothetical protein